MSKKTRKRISLAALALAVALTLSLGSLTSAFAADGSAIEGTEAAPAKAAITKVLKTPEGTNLPDITYSFEVTPVSKGGVAHNASTNPMPLIGTAVGSAGAGKIDIIIGASDWNSSLASSAGGIRTIPKESANILGVNFPDAGEYIYDVEEKTPASFAASSTFTETLTYSPAKYRIHVYVKNKQIPANGTFVFAVATVVAISDGTSGTSAGDKVDATPGGDPSVANDYSHMIFTNSYMKTKKDVDPEGTGYALDVSKKVTGDFGNMNEYFSFALTVAQPSISGNSAPFKGYVVSGGAAVDPTANGLTVAGTDSSNRKYFDVTHNGTTNFKLKHGQKVVIVGLPVGTVYSVNEAAPANYIPSVTVTTNGTAASGPSGSLSTALATGDQRVGEGANASAYTNANNGITPTGINLDAIPYIVMVALAAITLAAYIAMKSRRRSKNNA